MPLSKKLPVGNEYTDDLSRIQPQADEEAQKPNFAGTKPSPFPVNSGELAVSLVAAAQMLGVCKRTLERERDRGRLKCLRIGRHWKVRVAELHAYLRRCEAEEG